MESHYHRFIEGEMKVKDDKKDRQLTLHERWAMDGLPNVVAPTEETLAYVAWFKEQEKKRDRDKGK